MSARHLLCKKASRFSRILSFFVCLGASWGSEMISVIVSGVVWYAKVSKTQQLAEDGESLP